MSKEVSSLEEQLRAGKTASAFTRGVSMQPLLYERKTHVILQPLQRELVPGDLPIYRTPEGVYVIHRLIGADASCYYTRGDNCITSEKVPKEWMLGIVTEIFRNGKYVKVTDRGYRIYVAVWMHTYPVRRIFYFLRLKTSGLRRKLHGIVRKNKNEA